mgnify:CR=1 FL=1
MPADDASLSLPPLADADPWQVVSRLAPYLRIAHQIPGRVRLKLDTAALEDRALPRGGGEGLRQVLATVRGLRGVQINLLARSCVVEYDNRIIADTAWPDLLAARQTPAATTLVAVLQEKYEELRRDQLR